MLRKSLLLESMVQTTQEIKDLYVGREVPKVEGEPSAFDFHRKWVSKNCPCVFTNAVDSWPAFRKWNCDYLERTVGDKPITVAVTPNGYADAVTDGKFFLPDEKKMRMKEFFRYLKPSNHKENKFSYYIQKQNSNFTEEYQELLSDIESNLSWASEAFGRMPDAVNFWMGSSSSITSLHKDHYENIYVVIRGRKTFTLFPPTDRAYMPYQTFPVYKYELKNGQWSTVAKGETVPWIAIDPINPNLDKYPAFANATKITCHVNAGEVLYLPALWFHHVQQTDNTIAINFWYDMDFDMKYAFYQLLDKFATLMDNEAEEK